MTNKEFIQELVGAVYDLNKKIKTKGLEFRVEIDGSSVCLMRIESITDIEIKYFDGKRFFNEAYIGYERASNFKKFIKSAISHLKELKDESK